MWRGAIVESIYNDKILFRARKYFGLVNAADAVPIWAWLSDEVVNVAVGVTTSAEDRPLSVAHKAASDDWGRICTGRTIELALLAISERISSAVRDSSLSASWSSGSQRH
jgi:hypothetical protein